MIVPHCLPARPQPRTSAAIAAALLTCALGIAPAALAETITQRADSNYSDDWNTPAIWGGSAPGTGNQYLNEGDSPQHQFTTNASTTAFQGGELVIGGPRGDKGGGVLAVRDTGTQPIPNGLNLRDGGAIFMSAPGTSTLDGPMTLSGTGGRVLINGNSPGATLAFTGGISGSGGLTLDLGDMGHAVSLAGSNSYSGTTEIRSGGTLRQDGAAALTTGQGDTIVNGKLDLGAHNGTVAALTGAGRVTKDFGDTTLTLGANGSGDKTFSGIIDDGMSGTLAVVKTGDNRQYFSGNNTYSGGTTINQGELLALGSGTLGNGPVTVGGSGTLMLEGGSTAGGTTLAGRSDTQRHIDAVGGASAVGGLTLTGSATSSDQYGLRVKNADDTLTIDSITAAPSVNNPVLNLDGAGSGVVTGAVDLTGAPVAAATDNLPTPQGTGATIVKSGTGNWDLQGGVTGARTLQFGPGQLRVAGIQGTGSTLTLLGQAAASGLPTSSSATLADDIVYEQLVVTGDVSGQGDVLMEQMYITTQTPESQLHVELVTVNTDASTLLVQQVQVTTPSPKTELVMRASEKTMRRVNKISIGKRATLDMKAKSRQRLAAAGTADAAAPRAPGVADPSADETDWTVNADQVVNGQGTVVGNVAVDGTIEVGTDQSTAELEVQGNLTFDPGSVLKITIDPTGLGSSDLLRVTGVLTLANGLDLILDVVNGTLDDPVYILTSYGSAPGDLVGRFDPAVAPAGYRFDYAFAGSNVALVSESVPAPAPLVLIGPALLGLARLRWGCGRRCRS